MARILWTLSAVAVAAAVWLLLLRGDRAADVPPVAAPRDELPAAAPPAAPERSSVARVAKDPPEGGRMHVVVRGPAGVSLAAVVTVRANEARSEPFMERAALTAILDGAWFDGLPLGRSFTVAGRAQQLVLLAQTVAGPVRHDQVVEVELVLPDGAYVLSGRAVDEDGAPLGTRDLRLIVESHWGPARERAATAPDGRFAFALAGTDADDPDARASLCLLGDMGRDPPEAIVPVTLRVPRRGLHEVGEVRFAGVPLLAAGRVVDAAGAPVEGAEVVVWRAVPARLGRPPWAPATDLHVETGSAGRFTVRGETGHAELRLSARAEGFADSERLAFAHGDAHVRIVLHSAGRIAGRVVAAAALLEAGLLHGLLERSGKPGRFFPVATDGAFDVEAEPGVHSLTIRRGFDAGTLAPELARVEGITVLPGQAAQDPRLAAIELDGADVVSLELRGADGRVLRGVRAEVRALGKPGTCGSARDGRVVLVVRGLEPVEIVAPRYRRVRLDDPRAHTAVTLEPAIRVRLVLTPPLERGRLSIQLVDDTDESSFAAEADGRGGYVAELTRAGSHRLWGAGWIGSRAFNLTGLQPAAISVAEQSGEQAFTFALSPTDRAQLEK